MTPTGPRPILNSQFSILNLSGPRPLLNSQFSILNLSGPRPLLNSQFSILNLSGPRPLLNSQFSILNSPASPLRIQKSEFRILILLLLLPLFSFAQPIPHHDNVPKDPDAAAALFVKQFKQIIPYYSAEYHLTITEASLNKKAHSVRLSARLDADQTIQPEKEYYIPFIAAPDMPWDITLLADNGYDLCLQVNSDRTINNYYGHGGLMVIISNADLIKAVGKDASKRDDAIAHGNLQPSENKASDADMAEMARDYLVKYTQTISAHLPMRMGAGERFVQCYYQDSVFTMTLEYDDSVWTDIRQFLLGNLDDVRISRAQMMVEDTTNALAISAYVSESSIRHIYRNHSCTDSVDFTISPWMLDYVYTKSLSTENVVEAVPADYLLALAQQLDRQTPIQVDEETRLVKCTYDTITRLLSYIYDISDAQMLQFESNPNIMELLRERMLVYFKTDDSEVITLMDNLIAADATVSYTYRSPHGRQPMVFTFTAPEVAQARKK